MKLVYIAHPLRGNWRDNIIRAKRYCAHALNLGYAPIAPYLTVNGFLDDAVESQRALGLAYDLAVVPRCDELWLCGPVISEGMSQERDLAIAQGIPLRHVHLEGSVLHEDIGPGSRQMYHAGAADDGAGLVYVTPDEAL